MVNLDIPHLPANSPGSHFGTPHLTINRDATIDLDSSSAFEGNFLRIVIDRLLIDLQDLRSS